MHLRTQIRNRVLARLRQLTRFNNRVFGQRTSPFDPVKAGGPVLLVFCGDEEQISGDAANRPFAQTRPLQLHIRILLKGSDDLEEQLDDCLLDVETCLAEVGSLNGLLPDGLQLSSVTTALDNSLERPVGMVNVIYQAVYHTLNTQPDTVY